MINNFMKTQHHIIYKTTHPNGKFYGGRHSTYDLNDGYLGSGLWIREMKDRSVLTREIVAHAPDFETLVEMEEQWIAENYDDPNCMNFSRASSGWGSGDTNIMKDPSVVAKMAGDNHWTRNDPDAFEKLSKIQNDLVKKGRHPFVGDKNPNKDGRNARAAMENGTHINLTDNPSKQRSRNGTHQWFKDEDGVSVGGETNKKRIEEGTHNWLGPEENQRRIEAGTHNLLGSSQNEKMLAEGTHPSQKKITCPTCGWTVSSGMFKRWHAERNGVPQCHLDPRSPRYNPHLKPR